VTGTDIVVDGVLVAPLAVDLVVGTDSGDVLLVQGFSAEPVVGFDPELALHRVTGVVTLDDCASFGSPVGWDVLVARAARALAHELVGVAAATRGIATRHVQERQQFGRPIGAFQSVRHRLADGLIAETGARELLDADEPTDSVVELLLRKASAGRAALHTVQAAQQVCGAMGFTAEFGLHRYVRRAYVLDSLLGGSEDAEFDLGSTALATGRVPVAG
jgi:alkylation response protein AidB-like acyl-CoA dehydrogenase